MEYYKDQHINADKLRKKALEIMQKKEENQSNDLESMSSEKIRQILHELQVHQIELEIQNEELRKTQLELETARSYYYDLYDLAPVGYCTLSQMSLILKANLAAAELLGKTRNELLNQPISRFILPEDQDIYYFFRKQLFKTEQPQETELRMIGPNKQIFWVWLYASIVQDKDNNNICHIMLININERKQIEKDLIYHTFHDQLTGLFNRAYFEEESKRLNVERQLPISIIIADVNGLKLINDTFGHEMGDQLLKKVSGIFQKIFREEDIIIRWGGDEFLILLPQTEENQARKMCDRIREKCFKTDEFGIPISIALGYSEKENIEEELYQCINKADEIMYKNKLVESRSVKSNVLKALLNTLKAKCYETEEHAWRLQKMSRKIGEEIGLSDSELNKLFLLVTMHDIGKTSISKEILRKKGELDEEELKIMKKHPEWGYRIASATVEFSHVAIDILHHHEHWDGSGYPDGLKEKEIPLLSRIAAIVDAYDAMTNNRHYNNPKSHQEAIAELKQCAGSQFDPELVKVFLKLYENSN